MQLFYSQYKICMWKYHQNLAIALKRKQGSDDIAWKILLA